MLRRPPRPPLPPSAHDVLREARLLDALAGTAVRVPRVLLAHEDETALGVPFYVMDEVDGVVFHDELPAGLDTPAERARIGIELVDALAELHAVPPPEGLGGPTGYLERQLRRFAGLWELTRTRELPVVEEVHRRLAATMPESPPSTIVHGDYRLGNTMYASVRARPPPRDPRLGARDGRRPDRRRRLPHRDLDRARLALAARHLARHRAAGLRDQGRARRPLRGGRAAAGSSTSPGTSRSRSGRRRSSSRATTSGSSPARPTTSTTRSSTPACPRWPKPPGNWPRPRGRGIPALRGGARRRTIVVAGR